jgi:hypothetical protein
MKISNPMAVITITTQEPVTSASSLAFTILITAPIMAAKYTMRPRYKPAFSFEVLAY